MEITLFQKIAEWLFNFFTYLPLKVFNLLCIGITETINFLFGICGLCDFSGIQPDIQTHWHALGIYLLVFFNFPAGFQLILCALLIRFLIRRLPVVG